MNREHPVGGEISFFYLEKVQADGHRPGTLIQYSIMKTKVYDAQEQLQYQQKMILNER